MTDHDQLILQLQAEVVAGETRRSEQQIQALRAAAAACDAAGIDFVPIVLSTITDVHGKEEMDKRFRDAIADPCPPADRPAAGGTTAAPGEQQ